MRGCGITRLEETTFTARLQPSNGRCALATDTPPPVLQAIEELVRTSMEQVLNLLDWNEVFQSQTQSRTKWGSEHSKTGGWTSTRAYKQVAKVKLDLNKIRVFLAADKGYKNMGG